MKTLPIEYRHLYVNNLSSSGGPAKSLGSHCNDFMYCITYEFDGEKRELWRKSKSFTPIGTFVLQHENYLELYKTLDPEEGTQKDTLIQYDSVWNIADLGNGRASLSIQDS